MDRWAWEQLTPVATVSHPLSRVVEVAVAVTNPREVVSCVTMVLDAEL